MDNDSLFSIQFDAQRSARAIRVSPTAEPQQVLSALDLPLCTGIVVVHGGAGNMETELLSAVREFLARGLAPLAEERHLLVVDGGTQAGVPRVLGEARRAIGATFPLVGVTPYRYVLYPGGPAWSEDRIPLNPDHTHFALVDCDDFGAESPLLVGMLRGCGLPGLALIINGGQIVFQEVLAHAREGNTLVTVRDSGRIADQLADPTSEEHAALPEGVRLRVANLRAPEAFTAILKTALSEETR